MMSCPPWRIYESKEQKCLCGNSLHLINCDSKTQQLSVPRCYCMTYNEELKEVTFGQCLYTCFHHRRSLCHQYDSIKSNNSQDLNSEVCGYFKRTGHLCGKCIEGYGYPAYNNQMKCVKCNKKDFLMNIVKYLLLFFGPLTVFYFFIIFFRVSITSHYMVVYIYICQSITLPFFVKIWEINSYSIKIISDFASIWNLNIFHSIIDPFCLHPSLNSLNVMALDYLLAMYPMFLVLLTAFAVFLHDRYSIIVLLWSPMGRITKCIRKNWNIQGSLIQAFATFFVLSYVKIANTSFQLLTPVTVQNERGDYVQKWYLNSAGNLEYFGTSHLPYGILAVFMLLGFNLLPVIILTLYPFSWFKRYFFKNNLTMFTFLEVFYGCYRTKPTMCRSFAAVYFVARLLELLVFACFKNVLILLFLGLCKIILCIAVTLVQPYSKKYQNKFDVILLLVTCSTSLIFGAESYDSALGGRTSCLLRICLISCGLLLVSYGIVIFAIQLIPKNCQQKMVNFFKKKDDEELPLLSHSSIDFNMNNTVR